MFTIKQSYVQFTMTITSTFPTVQTTDQRAIIYSYLYSLHSVSLGWYICYCLSILTSQRHYAPFESHCDISKRNIDRIQSNFFLHCTICLNSRQFKYNSNQQLQQFMYSLSSSSLISYSINTSFHASKHCLVSLCIHEKVIDSYFYFCCQNAQARGMLISYSFIIQILLYFSFFCTNIVSYGILLVYLQFVQIKES